ncbi:hypothetical protein [Microtetraspora malaysiensis]|uniref:hypothetical protein n=1 Tax=Microtetraspora malaysiensis TaxID=161358 RepID=UPI003D8D6218
MGGTPRRRCWSTLDDDRRGRPRGLHLPHPPPNPRRRRGGHLDRPRIPRPRYAAATTAAWADLLSADCPRLFYSTSADNLSSQRVAERLGLRGIGRLWKFTKKS